MSVRAEVERALAEEPKVAVLVGTAGTYRILYVDDFRDLIRLAGLEMIRRDEPLRVVTQTFTIRDLELAEHKRIDVSGNIHDD